MSSNQQSQLAMAAADGNIVMAKRLLSSGYNCNEHEPNGMTVLSIAAFWGYTDMCRILINAGANLRLTNSGDGWTALHCAAFQGHGPVILMLLQAGADPNVYDSLGRSAADFASAIDAVWPLFHSAGCKRTPKQELIDKKIIIKLNKQTTTAQTFHPTSRQSRPTSAYVLANQSIFSQPKQQADSSFMSAACNGDVLANL